MNDIKTIVNPPQQMKGIMVQMVFSRSLSVVAELGVADLVSTRPMSVSEIAEELEADENALFRLIRILAEHGIFQIDKDGMVRNNDTSEFLREGIPGSQRNFARMMGSSWMWKVFNHLEHSVKTGEAAFGQAYQDSPNIFEYFKKVSPQDGMVFSKAMSGFSYAFDEPLTNAYDWSEVNRIVDLGGAEGRLLKSIKKQYPDKEVVLFDLPHVIQQARETDREKLLETVAGDFFQDITVKGDCFVIKYVLHNWNDDDCLKILQNCRKNIADGGRLLIMDMLVDNERKQVFEKSLDIVMMLLLGAKERTREEFEHLLKKSSFKINRVIPTQCPLSIIEVFPV